MVSRLVSGGIIVAVTLTGLLEENSSSAGIWDNHTSQYTEVYQAYQRILSQTDAVRREVFRLSREEGLTHRQISEQLSLSQRTVEFYISGVLRMLHNELKDHYILLVLFLFR